ncbi:hypothetical protein CAMRE0001_0380 [Campylobacter rectus RM3267]|uniref:Uncharacterized protein n=1 Tax=Campylobacter rectus RM3267 TaxID=553218 RepID=B9D2E9_CAMRE|nr:hypothetical protein CAMRE0001_0380 [Campylobacter rectus RM3267]
MRVWQPNKVKSGTQNTDKTVSLRQILPANSKSEKTNFKASALCRTNFKRK